MIFERIRGENGRRAVFRRIAQAISGIFYRTSALLWSGYADTQTSSVNVSAHLLRVAAGRRADEVSDSVVRALDGDGEVDSDSPLADMLARTDMPTLLYGTEYDLYTLGRAAWYVESAGTTRRLDGTPRRMRLRKVRKPQLIRVDSDGRLHLLSIERGESPVYEPGEFAIFERYDGLSADRRLSDALALFNRLWQGRRIASDRARIPSYVLETGGLGTQQQIDQWQDAYERRFAPDIYDAAGALKKDVRAGAVLLRGMRLRFPAMPEDKGAAEWIDLCIQVVSADSGVPAHDLGSRSNLTYSNQREFNAHFRDVIIEPECGRIARRATAQLSDDYLPQGGRMDIALRKSSPARLETDKMRADTRAVNAATVATLMQAGVMTSEEAGAYFRDLEAIDD